jgi:hypothetical protein
MKTTQESEEDQYTEKSLLHQEMLDLARQVSEAKRFNIVLKDQLRKKLLSNIVRELDSPTDSDLSPQAQEILGVLKMQTASSILVMQEVLDDLSSQPPPRTLIPEILEEDYSNGDGDDEASEDEAGDDEASEDEAGDDEADDRGVITRSNSLQEINLVTSEPQESVQITGDHSSGYSRDCCIGTDCVIL